MVDPNKSTQRLEGRVATILNAKELVINIGLQNGVELGMVFAVLAETPIQIKDPATGDILDQIDREKVRVKVTELRSRIAICSTYRVTPGIDIASIAASGGIFRTMGDAKHETLRIADSATPPPLTEEESYVKLNDRVLSLPERQYSSDVTKR